MADQAAGPRPNKSGEMQRDAVAELVNVNPDANPGHQIGQPDQLRRLSGRQDLVEQRLGLVLVGLLSERELAHEDLPGLGQHALLAR